MWSWTVDAETASWIAVVSVATAIVLARPLANMIIRVMDHYHHPDPPPRPPHQGGAD